MEQKKSKIFLKYLILCVVFFPRTLVHNLCGLEPCCRFVPTCSEYARQSFEEFQLREALWKILKRLLKCRPFGPYGMDHPANAF